MGNKPSSSVGKQTPSVDKDISETSSRCLTEYVTAIHNFEVTSYSLLQGKGADKFVSSSTFNVGGYGWNIRMHPDGWNKEDDAAYLSACLTLCSGTPDVNVKYTFSLLEKVGKDFHRLENMTRTFQSLGEARGWRKFIANSELQKLLSRTEDVSAAVVPVPESNLHTHFASMLKDGEGVDVTFTVGSQQFSAHKYVLAARSSVFKAELFGQMKESTMKHIVINHMEPAIFGALLHFIYTDSLPSNCDVDQNVGLQHLLVAADRYGLDRLNAMCEGKLCQKIDVQTVATTLALAEQHHTVQLKNACLGYLCSQDVLRAVKD